VDVDGNINLSADLGQVDWLGLKVGSHPLLTLHSSNEPGSHNGYGQLVMKTAPKILWHYYYYYY